MLKFTVLQRGSTVLQGSKGGVRTGLGGLCLSVCVCVISGGCLIFAFSTAAAQYHLSLSLSLSLSSLLPERRKYLKDIFLAHLLGSSKREGRRG